LLMRTLGLVVAASLPIVALYAVAGRLLLELAFGHSYGLASAVLPILGIAMTLLAVTYLSVQYLLALRHVTFLWVLAVAAILEVPVLAAAGTRLTAIALALGALQLALAGALVALDLHRERRPPSARKTTDILRARG